MKPAQPVEVIATLVAEQFFDACQGRLPHELLALLTTRIEGALAQVARQERESCAALCLRRQALWQDTEESADSTTPLRQEARFRGNEAAYLADALRGPGD